MIVINGKGQIYYEKNLTIAILSIVTLSGCSDTLESSEMEVSATSFEIDEDGNFLKITFYLKKIFKTKVWCN